MEFQICFNNVRLESHGSADYIEVIVGMEFEEIRRTAKMQRFIIAGVHIDQVLNKYMTKGY